MPTCQPQNIIFLIAKPLPATTGLEVHLVLGIGISLGAERGRYPREGLADEQHVSTLGGVNFYIFCTCWIVSWIIYCLNQTKEAQI